MTKTITHLKYTYKKSVNDARYTASMINYDGENIPLVFETSSHGANNRQFIGYKPDKSSFSPETLFIAVADEDTIKNLNIYVSNDGETYYQVYFILAHAGSVTLDIGSLIEYVDF
jgi:hypothetical protein